MRSITQSYNNQKNLVISCLLLSFCFSCVEKKHKPIVKERPNILIILADDLGYSDLGSYGGEIQTPNLDGLANNGIRFTQLYNSARCCPSRASLLTGLFPHQSGIGDFVGADKGFPGYAGRLKSSAVTLAEVLQPAGYRTFSAGKWHVNKPGPTERGFEEFYGFTESYGVDSWEEKWMERLPEGREKREYKEGEFFATNAITDHALDFLNLGKETPEKPWFMYLAYQAPHFPLQAPAADIEKYKEVYKIGWDSIRAQRLERMRKLGVVSADTELSPRSPMVIPEEGQKHGVPGDGLHNPAWVKLDEDRQEDLARRMAVYAAMIDNMDQNIGRVIEQLRKDGELDNTLILFMSDNGSCGEWDSFGFEYPDYNARVGGYTPGFPNVLHKGDSLDLLGGPDGPLFSYGSGWANVGNTPFSMYKMFTHEAGISSPLIMHWPKKIKEKQLYTDRYTHFVDIMATCVDAAEAEYPAVYNGNDITPMEGISLFKTLAGEAEPDRLLTFEHERHPAIRVGDWKLVSKQDDSMNENGFNEDAKFELYNVVVDRSETKDLSAEYPEKVQELKAKMLAEFNRIHVFPKP